MDDNTLTHSDIIQAQARTYAGCIFTEPIKKLDGNFNAMAYIQYVRFYLSPPVPTVGGMVIDEDFDYPVQPCLSEHRGTCHLLDANGDHASSNCPSTYHARSRKHDTLKRVIASFASEAGVVTRCEPDTFSLLLGEFSKPDCRRIFPKQMSKAFKTGFEDLSQAQAFISSAHCTLSADQKRAYIQNKIDSIPDHSGDATGLRIDVCLENPDTGETRWVDVTVAHTSCVSYRHAEMKEINDRQMSTTVRKIHMIPDMYEFRPSPTLLSREADKMDKYGRMVIIATKQQLDGKRSTLPVFVPFVVSDFGELAPQAIVLQEWIVGQYRRKCVNQGKRSNGTSTDELVRRFRHRFKMTVQFAVAAGVGNMIQAAGHPRTGRL